MKRTVGILAGLFLGTIGNLPAQTVFAQDGLSSSNIRSTFGQTVTFTATFSPVCADGASGAFTVDGSARGNDSISVVGTQGTATYSTSTLAVGTHEISFAWQAGVPRDPTCSGGSSLTQTVRPRPAPVSTPPPAASPPSAPTPSPVLPTPAASASPSVTPSAPASTSRVNLAASKGAGLPAGLAALAIAALVVAALVASRRVRQRTKR